MRVTNFFFKINYEVIVTDDSEDLDTKNLVELVYPWVKWVEGPRLGPAANRNNGARHAVGDWLIFTDDDCLPEKYWLQQYAEAIKIHPYHKAFEGAILPNNWDLLKKDMSECPVNDKGGCFWSANIMIQTKFFWELKGFDESFKIAANEDQRLYAKALVHTEIPFISSAVVIHPVRIVKLSDKLQRLKKSEVSQIRLADSLGLSVIQNYLQGLRIHSLAFINEFRKAHWRRATYNLIGFFFRMFAGPFLIYQQKKCRFISNSLYPH